MYCRAGISNPTPVFDIPDYEQLDQSSILMTGRPGEVDRARQFMKRHIGTVRNVPPDVRKFAQAGVASSSSGRKLTRKLYAR